MSRLLLLLLFTVFSSSNPFLLTHGALLSLSCPIRPTSRRNVRALNKFLDGLSAYKDVWFTTFQQMLSWVKSPRPATETEFKCEGNNSLFSCNRPHTCVVKHYLTKENSAATEDAFSRADTRYMPVCHSSLCPQQYQWFGNTAGKKHNFKSIMQLVDESPPAPSSSPSTEGAGGAGSGPSSASDEPLDN